MSYVVLVLLAILAVGVLTPGFAQQATPEQPATIPFTVESDLAPVPTGNTTAPDPAPIPTANTTAPDPAPTQTGNTTAPDPAPTQTGNTTAPDPAPTQTGNTTAPDPAPTQTGNTTAPDPAPTQTGNTTAPDPAPTQTGNTTAPDPAPTQTGNTTAPDPAPVQTTTEQTSPVKQMREGIPLNQIQCNDQRILIESPAGKPVCVFDGTVEKLSQRGWDVVVSLEPVTDTVEEPATDTTEEPTTDTPTEPISEEPADQPSESITTTVGNSTTNTPVEEPATTTVGNSTTNTPVEEPATTTVGNSTTNTPVEEPATTTVGNSTTNTPVEEPATTTVGNSTTNTPVEEPATTTVGNSTTNTPVEEPATTTVGNSTTNTPVEEPATTTVGNSTTNTPVEEPATDTPTESPSEETADELTTDTQTGDGQIIYFSTSSPVEFVHDGRERELSGNGGWGPWYDIIMNATWSPTDIDQQGIISVISPPHEKYSVNQGVGLYLEDWMPTFIPDGQKLLDANTSFDKYKDKGTRPHEVHSLRFDFVPTSFVLTEDIDVADLKYSKGFWIGVKHSTIPSASQFPKIGPYDGITHEGYVPMIRDGKNVIVYEGVFYDNYYANITFLLDENTMMYINSHYHTLEELFPVFDSIMQ